VTKNGLERKQPTWSCQTNTAGDRSLEREGLAALPEPRLKEGGKVLSEKAGNWVQDVTGSNPTRGGGGRALRKIAGKPDFY